MIDRRLQRKQTNAALCVVAALRLTFSQLALKLTLTASLLLGDGYRTVVICSGTQLLRVTVAPDDEPIIRKFNCEVRSPRWLCPPCHAAIGRQFPVADHRWAESAAPLFRKSPQHASAASPPYARTENHSCLIITRLP